VGKSCQKPLRSRRMDWLEQTTCFCGRSRPRPAASLFRTRVPTRGWLEQKGIRSKKRLSQIRMDALHIWPNDWKGMQVRRCPTRSSPGRWWKTKAAGTTVIRLEGVGEWRPRYGINGNQPPFEKLFTFFSAGSFPFGSRWVRNS